MKKKELKEKIETMEEQIKYLKKTNVYLNGETKDLKNNRMQYLLKILHEAADEVRNVGHIDCEIILTSGNKY